MAPAVVVQAAAEGGKVVNQIGHPVDLVGDAVKEAGGINLHASGVYIMITEIVTWISIGCMVFGGVVPYIPQYSKIRKTRDSEGFSTFVCLVLLVANILRILFWFGKHYELPLLLQSVVMIFTMLVMVHICVQVKLDKSTVARRLKDFKLEHFWKWTDFQDYCIFLLAFVLLTSLVTFVLLGVPLYVELLGLVSLLLEACLGLPQLYRNHVSKSTDGMSVAMVMMWLSGDLFKTCYFFVRSSPAQFWVCGSLQVLVDILILLQVFFYKKASSSSQTSRMNKP